MNVKVTDLRNKVQTGVGKLGYDGEEAQIITDVLMHAQLRDNNQGIAKIATGGVPKASEVEPFSDKNVIHNYGRGGAGFTLSWGCANEVVDLVEVL